MTFPAGIPGINPLPGIPGLSYLFTERDIIFSANNKTHIVMIGEGENVLTFPLQPIIEVRMGRNWVLTEVAGSAKNGKLSGTQIKENMGLSDAIITISGIFMSTGSTLTQMLRLQAGREDENIHWAEKLGQIKKLFSEERALPIIDWAPMEDVKYIPYEEVFNAWKNDQSPFAPKLRDTGWSMFAALGITHVVLLSFNLFERQGVERKGYTLRLQQARDISIEEIMPTEEAQ